LTPAVRAALSSERGDSVLVAILIVDDEDGIRRAIRRVLQPHHAVDDAASVDEARRKLAGERFELVLSDITMPGESGLELAQLVAGDAPDTVLVMVTGVDDPEIAAQALAMGAYGYLVKPFTTNELLIAVATALRRRTLELERATLEEHQRELGLLADRERIGRDLHDKVIQRLFATGLALESAHQSITNDRAREQVARAVDELDDTIRTIRTVIFEVESTRPRSLRGSVLDVARDAGQRLGFEPSVTFSGAIDTLVGGHAADQLLATLRESLSNVVRHAAAHHVDVEVAADREVSLTVRDDGVGISTAHATDAGGLGMANMTARAQRLGGRLTVERRIEGGTELEWRIPLEDR